jgi:hypothetical protein
MQGKSTRNKFNTLLKIFFITFLFKLSFINQTANAKNAYTTFVVTAEIPKQCSINIDPSKFQNYDIIKILISANINVICNHLVESSIKIINKNKQLDNNNIALAITKNKLESIKYTKDSLVSMHFKSTIRSDSDDDFFESNISFAMEKEIEPKLFATNINAPQYKIDNENIKDLVVYLEVSY